MNRENIIEKLKLIFQDNFDDENIELTEKTILEDIKDWDSIEQINLIVIIQEDFKIRFTIDEINSMKSIGHIVDLIIKKMR